MNRENLKVGMKVKVVPTHCNKDLPTPKETEMFVRELHNPLTAGLSRRKTGKKHIVGVLYDVIQLIKN